MGALHALDPPLCVPAWTTIATGYGPESHGILGAVEPDLERGRLYRARSGSRRQDAVWTVLERHGLRSLVVGWPGSHPAEAVGGVSVSDLFPLPVGVKGGPWPVPGRAVWPAEREAELAPLRVHAGELEPGHLLPFVPEAARVDQERDPRLSLLAGMLAECFTRHALITHLMATAEWDLAAVYFPTLRDVKRLFAAFHPPRRAETPEEPFRLYQHVVTEAYRFHDAMLARLLQLAGKDAHVMVVSDHGYETETGAPATPPASSGAWEAEAGRVDPWHRREGLLVLRGPLLRRDERVEGASILDVMPTLLALFGLPQPEGVQGRVLRGAFEVPGVTSGRGDERAPVARGEPRSDPAESTARPDERDPYGISFVQAGPDVLREVERERRYNLARALLGRERPGEARPLLEALWGEEPDNLHLRLLLAQTAWFEGDRARCRALLEGVPEGDSAREPLLDLLRGVLLVDESRFPEAATALRRAEAAPHPPPAVTRELGRAFLALGWADDAARAFRRALAADSRSASSWEGLATALAARGEIAAARDAALEAVQLRPDWAAAQYRLGELCLRLDEPTRGRVALRACLALDPHHGPARALLARLREDEA